MKLIINCFFLIIVEFLMMVSTQASTLKCEPITKAPHIITKSGCFYLKNDIMINDTSTNAITIRANDVTLNLAGFQVIGPKSTIGSNAGVYGSNLKNILIENGIISNFLYGIRIDGEDVSTRITISKIEALGNYFRGVRIDASESIVKNNKIKDTGGTNLYPDSFAMGIEVIGRNSVIRGNLIDGVNPVGVGEGVGISLSRKRENSIVEENIIKGNKSKGSSFGIWLSAGFEKTKVSNNIIYGYILPFSIPSGHRQNSKKSAWPTTQIYNNKSFATACGIDEFPTFYKGLSNTNLIISRDGEDCPLLISNLTFKNFQNKDDPFVTFRLAQAMYWCSDEPKPLPHICFHLKQQSINLFERAEKLGVKEATRVLPAIRKAVQAYSLRVEMEASQTLKRER